MKKRSVLAAALIIVTLLTGCKSAGDKLAADGATAHGEKRYADAIELLTKASNEGLKDYKQFELDLMLADSYLQTGDNEQAIAFSDKVLTETKDSGHYRAYTIKGIAEKRMGLYDAALESYTGALEYDNADKDSVGLYESIGNLYISRNEPLKAIDYLTKAINLDPTFAAAYGDLAIAYAILFDFDSAERALSDAKTQGYAKVDEVQAIIDKYKNFGADIPAATTTNTTAESAE
jgi:tetratricopeptide (TPR) repeat protein